MVINNNDTLLVLVVSKVSGVKFQVPLNLFYF